MKTRTLHPLIVLAMVSLTAPTTIVLADMSGESAEGAPAASSGTAPSTPVRHRTPHRRVSRSTRSAPPPVTQKEVTGNTTGAITVPLIPEAGTPGSMRGPNMGTGDHTQGTTGTSGQ